jgi:hypothetical protein
MYIYQLPFKPRQNVVDILNSGESWRNLGGIHMGYTHVELDKFALYVHKPGASPADAMLSHWGTKNPTVIELFLLLRDMGHLQAMEALRKVVPEEYHVYIRAPPPGAQAGQVENHHCQMPPPPVMYSQAKKSVQDNLDTEVKKNGYSERKMQTAADQSGTNE